MLQIVNLTLTPVARNSKEQITFITIKNLQKGKGQSFYLQARWKWKVERALASQIQTYREAHMVSETDTGTLQRLLRGNHSLCQGLRAQGLWCGINNTNGAMREKTRREGMRDKNTDGKMRANFQKHRGWKAECYSSVRLRLSAFSPRHGLSAHASRTELKTRRECPICACMRERRRENKGDSPWSWSVSVSVSTRSPPAHSADRFIRATLTINLKSQKYLHLKMFFKPEESRLLAWQRLESKHKGEAANRWNWQKPEAPSCRKTQTISLMHRRLIQCTKVILPPLIEPLLTLPSPI